MDTPNEEQEIRSDAKNYFTMLPNMADDDLPVYEFRLYAHYARVCGQGGKCTETVRTTATRLGISTGSVTQIRQKLAERNYIKLIRRKVRNFERVDVVLSDLWPENINRYANATVSPSERYRSRSDTVPSLPVNATVHVAAPLKKNQLKEEPLEKENRSLRSLNGADAPETERTNERIFSLLTDPEIGMSSRNAIERIASSYPFEDIRAFCCKFVSEGRAPGKDAGLIAYWLEAAEVAPAPTGADEFFRRHSTPDEQHSIYIPDEYDHLIVR